MKSMEDLTFEMDDKLGNIGCRLEILEAVKEKLMILTQDMDEAKIKKVEKLYFEELHREMKISSELMFFVMGKLNDEYEELYALRKQLQAQLDKNE